MKKMTLSYLRQKNIFGKKTQTEILAKTSKNAKFRDNWASEATFYSK